MGTLALGRAGCEQSHSAIHETLACACVWAALWRSVGLCERERAALGPAGVLGEGYGSRALTEACA